MMVDMTLGRQGTLDRTDRDSTLMSATFEIEYNGKTALFSELAGITSELEQAEYMEAGLHGPMFGRFIGRAKPPTVTLKRSMTKGGGNSATTWIWAWHAEARTGVSTAYRDVSLKLYGAGSKEPVKQYAMTNAIPTKVELNGMKAGGTEVVLQTLTIMCDAIEEV
jgi:phage tail-like protein